MYSLQDTKPSEELNGQSVFSHSGWENPQIRKAGNPNNISSESLLPRAKLYDEVRNEQMVFKENIYNELDDVKIKEEVDKYIIHFKDDDINKKELKVNFNKEENELKLEIFEKHYNETGEEYFVCNFESSVKFDKAVKFDEMIPDTNNGNVSICIPKVHKDAENLLNMQLKNTSVDNLRK